ncbi:hypothetical protein P153DRAFT_362491 [Dothidotthia symphoricarpi CBS 119687]|uniref:DUF6590 domain-containing protein n=1 Tax=Dothidotthia symphoricarpi CBS 119687 TaxID=1392245 RepID=A0A6A6AU65_9PLEO|nr:uncharacterized protein P153DRAFT_362491 [Dothidotthia symphoricarpi CBS 119687]KAF2134753.1 hypothetical protein P153DRAFT_362491 [Dothidotthia symphoricarpi CBS 119687]
MGFTTWEFDQVRKTYYYYDPDSNTCVYADDTGVPPPETSHTPTAAVVPTSNHGRVDSTILPAATGIVPSDTERLQKVARNVEVLNAQTTPADLQQFNITPRFRLRETPGEAEGLDESFCIRRPGYKYFKKGVIFRVLWPELAGDVHQNMTIATTPRFPNENIFCKIRWFVVVREGHDCSTCLSIQTYGNRGVPQNKEKYHHAIMFTGNQPPQPLPSEQPRIGELGMGTPIHVEASRPYNRMDPLSRVNFVKVYTIEHNVKVEDFGRVNPLWEHTFLSQFYAHWGIPFHMGLPPATRGPQYNHN